MKKLLSFGLLLLAVKAVNAAGADAFVEGLARGFNRAYYGQDTDSRDYHQPERSAVTYSYDQPTTRWFTTVTEYGTPTGMQFSSLSNCKKYAASNGQACVMSNE